MGNDEVGLRQDSPVWHKHFQASIRRYAKLRSVNGGTGGKEDPGFESIDTIENTLNELVLVHVAGQKADQKLIKAPRIDAASPEGIDHGCQPRCSASDGVQLPFLRNTLEGVNTPAGEN